MTFFKKCISVLFLLSGLAFYVQANVVIYDESRGLSNHVISQLAKDRSGLLWIGTESGLNTFDGYNFKEVEYFRGTKIFSLCYDDQRNMLWVGCNTGLFLVNVSDYSVMDCTSKLKEKAVYYVLTYRNAVFAVFANGHVLKIREDGTASAVFNISAAAPGINLIKKQIATDQLGNLFMIPDRFGYMIRLNLGTGQHEVMKQAPAKEIWNIASGAGYCVAQWSRKGISVVNTSGTPYHILEAGQKEVRIGLLYCYKNEYYASLRDQYGVYKLNLRTQAWELLKSNDNVSFKSKIITTVFRDVHNVLWVGTNKGLVKMTLQSQLPFHILLDGYSPAVSCRQIVKGKRGNLFVASYNGIYKYNLFGSQLLFLDSAKNDSVFPLYTRALLYDDNQLYQGTESSTQFFYRINLLTRECEGDLVNLKPVHVQINSVYNLHRDEKGIIWLATDKGLASYDKSKETFTLHTNDPFNVGVTRLFYLAPVDATRFWAVGRNGAYLVDINTGVQKQLIAGKVPGLPADDYIFAGVTPKGTLWLGSKKSGIVTLDPDYEKAGAINTSNGLSANEVYGILWQDNVTAWISTVNGLCRYNSASEKFCNYFYEDGICDNEFNQNSFLRYADSLFFFGGINGLTYFNPQQVKPDPDLLTIFTASATKWNQGLQSFVPVRANDHIIMEPDDHLLAFTFGLSDYSNTEGHSYFYRIKGLYNEWVSLGNQNILRLEGIPAGDYMVEVKGVNKRGMSSTNSLQYTIKIVQVFYKTWWFYVLLALGISLLIYGYFKWRLLGMQQKQKLRTQIASNLHDEVGSLLTSIIISTDSARYSSNTVEEKNIKLEKISALSRDATSTMSDVLWSIDARNDYAGNLTDRMREHAEAMLLPLDIDVQFDFTATQQEQNMDSAVRQQLYLIFKEAVNNIAKHSNASEVRVYYKQQGKLFEMVVENDTHDTDEASAYLGQGLKNMEMRAKKIKAGFLFSKSGSHFRVTVKNHP